MPSESYFELLSVPTSVNINLFLQTGYGYNHLGHYSTSLITALHKGCKARPDDIPSNVKAFAIFGAYLQENYGNYFYGKAQNLVPVLTAAYDKALSNYDVLIMPTVPHTATKIPPQDIKIKGKSYSRTWLFKF